MRCRDDLRCARTAARNRVTKQLLRHGRVFRDGKTQWTLLHRQWIVRQPWLGIVPSEYSSGQQRHRGHITRTGNRHARRLLIEAAWSYRHPPRLRDRGPQRDQRAWQAEIRLHRRYRHLTSQGKRPTIATVAVARELTGFLWAATTNQPILQEAAA